MSNLSEGFCLRCNREKISNIVGFFTKRPTGKCVTCGYTLVERRDTRRDESTSRSMLENTTNFYDIPFVRHTASTADDNYHGHGGSFGGGGASSSWDSSSSSSDSGGSGGGGD